MKADHPQAVNEAPIDFSAATMTEMKRVIGLFPEGKQKSAILSVLHLVQDELGWVSVGAMNRVAQILDIEPIEVYEVATFYTMFHLDPVGKNVLEVEHRLVKVIPKEFIVDSHHWLILHGRYCCIARKPKCHECIVSDVCNWPDRFEFGAARIATTTIEAEH